ncbi:MAG: methenyltetrahydromethanopterin cyclohydrolase [Acetobacteraceae bacterium]
MISVNQAALPLVTALCEDAEMLRIGVSRGERGETLIDAGAKRIGGIAAGLRIAAICMGGLGSVRIDADAALSDWPWSVSVTCSQPVIGCLGSQYAGWSLSSGEKQDRFTALGSGPARAVARKEKLFAEIGYADMSEDAVLVLESARPPPPPLLEAIATDCGVTPERLTVIYAPTQSLAGTVQVVARVLEVALHKAHELGFVLERIVDGMGVAPLPPPHPDLVTAMGRTNDAIILAGRVRLFVSGPATDARALAEALPAAGSRDYGRPFAEIFRAVRGDFYAIDPMLFSPAVAVVTALETGETFQAGRIDQALLQASFG